MIPADLLSRREDHLKEMKEQPIEEVVVLPDNLFINLIDAELQEIVQMATKDDALARKMVQELGTTTNTNWMISTINDDNFVLFYNGAMYIPNDLELRRRIVSQFHNGPLAGHPGISETTTQVQREYYWPGMRSFIRHYINGCGICQQFKYIC